MSAPPDGKKYYSLFDGLGSIVGMTDSTGNEVNRYDDDPYDHHPAGAEGSALAIALLTLWAPCRPCYCPAALLTHKMHVAIVNLTNHRFPL
jgi:hypothetical protein